MANDKAAASVSSLRRLSRLLVDVSGDFAHCWRAQASHNPAAMTRAPSRLPSPLSRVAERVQTHLAPLRRMQRALVHRLVQYDALPPHELEPRFQEIDRAFIAARDLLASPAPATISAAPSLPPPPPPQLPRASAPQGPPGLRHNSLPTRRTQPIGAPPSFSVARPAAAPAKPDLRAQQPSAPALQAPRLSTNPRQAPATPSRQSYPPAATLVARPALHLPARSFSLPTPAQPRGAPVPPPAMPPSYYCVRPGMRAPSPRPPFGAG